MIKKFFTYAWSVRHEFAKYFIVGVSGVFLDLGTLIILKEIVGIQPVFAVMVNQALVLGYNFSLNKYWSFRNQDMPHEQVVRYLMVAGLNYIFSAGMMYIFNHHLGWDYRLVRIGTIAMMVPANFLLYKYWVYRKAL